MAAYNGLFQTTDNGFSWDYIEVDTNYCQFYTAVEVDRLSPQNLYVAVFPRYNNIGIVAGFYRSTDNGSSWEFYNEGLPLDNSYGDIAVSYLDENNKRIFLASRLGIYRSDDLGETWTQCANGLPTNLRFSVIKISPVNAEYIITGDEINRVFLSTDRGEAWYQAEDLPEHPLHEYINDIEFHPTDTDHIFACSYHLGLFETTDGGESWNNINNNLPLDPDINVISGITINPQNPLNMFVSSNHMGIYQSHDGGQSWESFNAGLDTTSTIGHISFVTGDTTILYFASHDRSVWTITRTPTGVEADDLHLPSEIILSGYPNPFNAQTNIVFNLPQSGKVNISIYNINGQLVETIADGFHTAGNYALKWDASALAQTGRMASGIYFCTLKAENVSKTTSLVLLK